MGSRCVMMSETRSPQPALTASGRRKKPDKWANELKKVTDTYETLVQTVSVLEEEQRSLRAKETVLLQVLDIMQALVASVSFMPSPAPPQDSAACTSSRAGSASAHTAAAKEDDMVVWLMVVAAVQQREQEITQLYGNLLSTLYPCYQQQLHGVQMLKQICSPDCMPKVSSMTADQMTTRLSSLAGKVALQILSQQDQTTPADAPTASIRGPLYDSYQEFSGLIMGSMMWDNSKFMAILQTNLDTLQPFSEPLPAQHWVSALQQLRLSDEQMRVLCCLHDQHFWKSRLQVSTALDRNMRQQQAHTDAFAAHLQQLGSTVCASPAEAAPAAVLVQEHLGDVPASGSPAWDAGPTGCSLRGCAAAEVHAPVCAAGVHAHACAAGVQAPICAAGVHAHAGAADMRAPAGAAGVQAHAGAGTADLLVQYEQLQGTQEALIQERQQLLRRWLLLGLHVGIVTACTMSTYQQAVFVAASYPSIPRLDLAIAAWQEQQKLQQQQEAHGLQQATHTSMQAGSTRPGSASASAPGQGASTPENMGG